VGAHAQRLRPRRGPHPGRGDGERPEHRRLDHRACGAAPVHGRPGAHSVNAPAQRGWDKVEYWSSYFLLAVLGSVILTRLGFASVWSVPTLDLVLGSIALLLIVASPWIARRRRALRIAIVAYAAAPQLVPVSVRHPAVLLP